MKTEFMALWDGFTTDEYSQVMVLGATNRPWEVDEAVLRRLPQSFLVGLPDQQQREAILSKMLEGEVMDESFYMGAAIKKLGSKTAGYSGSDLKQLCTNAAYYPIRDLLQAEREKPSEKGTMKPRALNLEDFVKALAHSKPTGEAAMEYMRTKVMEVIFRSFLFRFCCSWNKRLPNLKVCSCHKVHLLLRKFHLLLKLLSFYQF